eukprot:c11981_g1_i1 orf=148-2613(+)
MAAVDYESIYKNVNEIARVVGTDKIPCSEVMACHRMFVRLDTLSVEELVGSSNVKQLIVFADVVEIQDSNFTLPGSTQIFIACRILDVKTNKDIDLTLDWQVVNNINQKNVPRCAIYAQKIVSSSSTKTGTILLKVKYQRTSSSTPVYFGRQFSYSADAVSAAIEFSTTAQDYNLELIDSKDWIVNINGIEWSAYVDLQFGLPSIEELAEYDMLTGLQSTLLIAEMILNYRTDLPDAVTAAIAHVQWANLCLLPVVGRTSLQGADQLLPLLGRAQSLLKLPIDGSKSLVVPRLEYSGYEKLIAQMVSVVESYNSEFTLLTLFIQQNQITAAYLLEQNKAFAAREKDMAELESMIVDRKKQELEAAFQKMTYLNDQLQQQTQEMEQAKADMDAGIQKYKDEQVAKAFFAVIKGILGVGLAIATGGATSAGAVQGAVDAVEKVSQLAKVLQKVMDILEGLEELASVLSAIKDLLEAIEDVKTMVEAPEMTEMPTMSDWDIFENEVEAVAEQMPEEVSEVPVWKAKCKNVAAVCREISTTAAYMGQLEYDLFVHGKQKEIAEAQAKRLESIKPADLTNYLEMATQLDMRTTRLLVGLLKMLTVQNGALQYHYLLQPKPFTGWPTMDGIRRTLVQNEHNAVVALEQLGFSTDFTRTYVLNDVPVHLLLSGEDWNFTIPVDDPTFPSNWSRVRIVYLEINFTSGSTPTHLPTTSTGEVYFLLQASRMFQDRLEEEHLQYEAATPLQYQYAYVLATGETTVSNYPTQQEQDARFLRMTPFTSWRLRLSASADENKGLSFPSANALDSTTQISITFYLTAIRKISTRR